jgi:exopolyphosphatase/guanosine-5'-triphosphate,3'-diphosphate pyrophosphatase
MRVAVVDIGTNSTRLLIADVSPEGDISELVRRSTVTRLGEGVDRDGTLSDKACARVLSVLERYRAEIDAHAPGSDAGPDPGATPEIDFDPSAAPTSTLTPTPAPTPAPAPSPYPSLAVLTSAARDASNGAAFAERIRAEYRLDARVLSGEEEARMTFLGAMSGRARKTREHGEHVEPTDNPDPADPANPDPANPADPANLTDPADPATSTVVIDVGGGSTELIVGSDDHRLGFHTSVPAGVVRMGERHIHSDPPAPEELQRLAADTHAIFHDGLPLAERDAVTIGIAVAGTATSAAAIDQELDPYDPARVHGYRLLLATVEMLLARLADMDEAQRQEVVGLDPARAPTIVAGMIILSEAMRAFELDEVEVSEHDILHGGALMLVGLGSRAE